MLAPMRLEMTGSNGEAAKGVASANKPKGFKSA
jgi:hypothetical protein